MAALDERAARVLLNMVPGLAPERIRRLLERFGSAEAVWAAESGEWAHDDAVPLALSRRMEKIREQAEKLVGQEMASLDRAGLRIVIPSDPDFPAGLKTLSDCPLVLYVKGDLKPVDALAVALVGTRVPTPYGKAVAERLATELSSAGVTLVSGLARGVDTVVHSTALKHRGRTIGVLGSGFERFYPPENKPLAEKMARQGAVVTEFSMSTPPDRYNFPRRNRIIAALSLGVVVVEADEVSGALITARLAAEQGRDVFAVPGPVFSKYSRGPHRLLRQGARLVESAEDILDEIEAFRQLIRRPARPPIAEMPVLSENENSLLAHLSLEPSGLDALSARSGLPPPAVVSTLLELELKGLVRALPGQTFVRAGAALPSVS